MHSSTACAARFANACRCPFPRPRPPHALPPGTLSLRGCLQVDELSGQKGFIHSDREIKAQCTQLIQELRLRVGEHIKTSQTITDCLRRILTPLQVAKFLVWVERNQRSMDLLNNMFQSDEVN